MELQLDDDTDAGNAPPPLSIVDVTSSSIVFGGKTPRQSKQSERLRRLVESGDHELGQDDEAEVRYAKELPASVGRYHARAMS
jgi:hypothetical protein